MVYRKFKGIQCPVPGVDTAISYYTWDEAAYQADNTTGWVLETRE